MAGANKLTFRKLLAFVALTTAVSTPLPPAWAGDFRSVESAFDNTFGTEPRAPQTYDTAFEARIASLANADRGRIGVAAIDLSTGRTIDVLGDQPFPLASTGKVAIVATFLDGVDKGRFKLTDKYPLMVPLPSHKFDGPAAPVRPGQLLTARSLIELALTRSDNEAADALLAVIGGPPAVDAWLRRAGISNFHLNRTIATLVRDDGAIDPATTIDRRDSTTPEAMVQLLTGLYHGKWLSDSSRAVLLGAMHRCITGKRRIPALLPDDASVAHKTGSLHDTSSDVGIITAPDGNAMAVAIYVTGQGTRHNREERIATIARAIYDGYSQELAGNYPQTASR